jgi:hypothetical protein
MLVVILSAAKNLKRRAQRLFVEFTLSRTNVLRMTKGGCFVSPELMVQYVGINEFIAPAPASFLMKRDAKCRGAIHCARQRSRFPSACLNHAFSQNTPAIRRGRFIATIADLSAPRGLTRHPPNLSNFIISPPWLSCYPPYFVPSHHRTPTYKNKTLTSNPKALQ